MEKIKITDEQDLLNHLEGKWTSADGKMSLEIIGTGMINISGAEVVAGASIGKSRFSLEWDSAQEQWLITNTPVFGAMNSPLIIEKHSFSIGDLSYPANVVMKFGRDGFYKNDTP